MTLLDSTDAEPTEGENVGVNSEKYTVERTVTIDAEASKFYLTWLIISLMIVICLLVISFLLWKFLKIFLPTNLLSHGKSINDTPRSPVSKPDNSQFDDWPHLVELKKFEDYVHRICESGELELQFKMLPRGLQRPCEYGNSATNGPKNRRGSVIAYDETRVILGEGLLRSSSNYINANYIQGYCKEKAYIATQGPMSNTIVDFWRMIWQEEVRIICMLVNVCEGGKKMCEQYWPEIGKTVEYGNFTILNLNQRKYAHYTYRTFQLTSRHELGSRKVKHLQYTGWPEQGVPMYSHSIVEYLNEIRALRPGHGPIVVHCSTGGGRTGTIILCDICLRSTAAEGMVNPFAMAQKMYNARANMLDNRQQYLLAHLMPVQCLLLPSTKLSCRDITVERIEKLKQELPTHMQILAVSSWKEQAFYTWEPPRLQTTKHVAKNRFPKLMPGNQSLVTLKRFPQDDTTSDYISAVSVDGVRVEEQYIASQLPLLGTLADFWRLVAEKEIELIILLQRPSPEDISCIDIIPSKREALIPVPYIKVEYKTSFNYGEYLTMDELLLTDTSEERTRIRNVTVLTCNNWSLADNAEPPPPEVLVELWSTSEGISRAEAPTLVLCHDGVTGCGLYLALSFLLERIAVEQELNVILAVRAIRRSRPEFVISKAQFEYLYDAAVKFLQNFETYANFT